MKHLFITLLCISSQLFCSDDLYQLGKLYRNVNLSPTEKLYRLVLTNDITALDDRLSKDPSITPQDKSSLLHFACALDRVDSVECLSKYGISLFQRNKAGQTPLHNAILHNATDIALLLLTLGAPVNEKDAQGRTPLHDAACCKNEEVINLLVNTYKANVHAQDNANRTPLYYALLGEPSSTGIKLDLYLHFKESFKTRAAKPLIEKGAVLCPETFQELKKLPYQHLLGFAFRNNTKNQPLVEADYKALLKETDFNALRKAFPHLEIRTFADKKEEWLKHYNNLLFLTMTKR